MENDTLPKTLPPNINDHDLLIVLYTTMQHMAKDISTIKDESLQRIAVLEEKKQDKEEYSKEAGRILERLNAKQSKEDAESIRKTFQKAVDDHEARMRAIEKKIYWATGALALLQIIIGSTF